MAGIESIQCPKCGSPLEVTRSTFQARCSYCASMLRVSRDASGQPLAVLDDIREDTDILATDVVRRRLEERLRERLAARYELACEYEAALKKVESTPGRWTVAFWAVVVGWVTGAIVGLSAVGEGYFSFWAAVVGAAVVVWVVGQRRKNTRTKVREWYDPRMRALEAVISEAQRQLRTATARMDGLITDAGGH